MIWSKLLVDNSTPRRSVKSVPSRSRKGTSVWNSLCEMHRASCRRGGDATAIRFRRGGRWRDLEWGEYRRLADAAAANLALWGVAAGERVALLSENRVEWPLLDHALLSAGAITVPLHTSLSAEQIEYQLDDSGVNVVLVSERLWPVVRPVLRGRDAIVFGNANNRRSRPWLRPVKSATSVVEEREAKLGPDDPATIIYTSGTTGEPRGVVLTHGNLLFDVESTLARADYHADDVHLNWLPFSHVYARVVDHYLTSMHGMTICLADSPETVVDDLREVQPTCMTGVPRLYEKIWNSVAALDAETRRAALWSVFGPNVRHLSSGGAPLPVDVCRGYQEAGLPLLEGYGMTESSAVITFNALEANRAGTVGRPIDGVDVRIAEDGEVLTRGPHVMPGYWNDPAATAEAIVDGWLHTGDLGEVGEDGFLRIVGRKKELIVLSNGKNVVPTHVETVLQRDPLVEQAFVVGDGQPCCSAIVVLDRSRLEIDSDDLGIVPELGGDLVDCPPLVELLMGRLDHLQASLAQHERVRRVVLVAEPFAVESGELTPSMKLCRRVITERRSAALATLG